MTNEERDLITTFITRVAGVSPAQAAGPSGSPWAGPSVPAPAAPPLPPIDPEADALIASLLQGYPAARYRLTQLAFVQEHALAAAQARIRQLEAQLQQAAQAQSQSHGGFLSGLFGGGRPAAPPPSRPPFPPAAPGGYPPGTYPQGAPPMGMFQRSGPGFLGSALTTAAGVAGGVVLGNALMDLFSPSHAAAADQGATMLPPGDAWSAPPDQGDASGWTGPDPNAGVDPGGWVDPNAPGGDPFGGQDQSGQDQGGAWDQGDSGWDQGGGPDDTLV